jgi:hypothetical protein
MSKKLFPLIVIGVGVAFALGWLFGPMAGFRMMQSGVGSWLHPHLAPLMPAMSWEAMPFGLNLTGTGMLLFGILGIVAWLGQIVLTSALLFWLIRPRAPHR